MENNLGEWNGSKSNKFKRGKQTVFSVHKSTSNFFSQNSSFCHNKSLENIKSKKHFIQKKSEVANDWRPCVRIIASLPKKLKPIKISDYPSAILTRPSNNIQKSSISCSNIKKPIDFCSVFEDQEHVKSLDLWEKNKIEKPRLSQHKKVKEFRSILEGYRISLPEITLKISKG